MKRILAAAVVVLLFSLIAGADSFDSEQQWLACGDMMYMNHDYTNAVACYETALIINPDNYNALLYAGYSYYMLGDYKNAVSYLEAANAIKDTGSAMALAKELKRLSALGLKAGEETSTKRLQNAPYNYLFAGFDYIAEVGSMYVTKSSLVYTRIMDSLFFTSIGASMHLLNRSKLSVYGEGSAGGVEYYASACYSVLPGTLNFTAKLGCDTFALSGSSENTMPFWETTLEWNIFKTNDLYLRTILSYKKVNLVDTLQEIEDRVYYNGVSAEINVSINSLLNISVNYSPLYYYDKNFIYTASVSASARVIKGNPSVTAGYSYVYSESEYNNYNVVKSTPEDLNGSTIYVYSYDYTPYYTPNNLQYHSVFAQMNASLDIISAVITVLCPIYSSCQIESSPSSGTTIYPENMFLQNYEFTSPMQIRTNIGIEVVKDFVLSLEYDVYISSSTSSYLLTLSGNTRF